MPVFLVYTAPPVAFFILSRHFLGNHAVSSVSLLLPMPVIVPVVLIGSKPILRALMLILVILVRVCVVLFRSFVCAGVVRVCLDL